MAGYRSLSSSSATAVDDRRHPHVPVLIVGAGPVGLVLSFILTKLGYLSAFFLLYIILFFGLV